MKTLRRLVVSPRPITEKQKEAREKLAELLHIPGVLTVKTDYRHVPNILEQLRLEADNDLEERSLKEALAEPGYHNIHLMLTDNDWQQLGIRGTLRGQAREVDGQGITYGRAANNFKQYRKTITKYLTPETLVEWHELDHNARVLLNVDPTSTHYHFYGYARRYRNYDKDTQNAIKPRRYARSPDPLEAWRALPWQKLPDLEETYRRDLLLEILQLAGKLLNLLLVKQNKLVKPLRAWGQNVSQEYANYNPNLYPLTKHHIGVDHAVVKGTPIYAPDAGTITDSGYTPALGYYCTYQYKPNRYLVALHLDKKVALGKRAAGEQIATVGDTGRITGVHSHLEVWTVPVNRISLPADMAANWREYTRNPLTEF